MAITKFFNDAYGRPGYEADDERYWKLGIWLTMEIGTNFAAALDALDSVAEALAGAADAGDWEGESMEATFTPTELVLVDYDGTQARYPMAEVQAELERYWRFLLTRSPSPDTVRILRPDLPEHEAYLLQWEETWKKRHPYRGRIEGIPATGPE
ncbi:hypothetical protein [Glycomyces artemisiae]|uniref:Uncharacterized protein n=1 Tax=Glycomyces artemisiae TaxID=1076443 RepID=A0A2T0USZ6_9ACTN|nr:hypothetical protein [Glycomyces artemisiae]PRY61033.1 hypothetical protein B0I28_102652 [Glycomyces artemisiae]